jgi:hypothetical protein
VFVPAVDEVPESLDEIPDGGMPPPNVFVLPVLLLPLGPVLPGNPPFGGDRVEPPLAGNPPITGGDELPLPGKPPMLGEEDEAPLPGNPPI